MLARTPRGQAAGSPCRIDALPAGTGTDRTRLPSVIVVPAGIRDASAMGRGRDAWPDPRRKPARMPLQALLPPAPAWRVEITGVAGLAARDQETVAVPPRRGEAAAPGRWTGGAQAAPGEGAVLP